MDTTTVSRFVPAPTTDQRCADHPDPGVTEWVIDNAMTVFRLWDEDVIERCKPHYGQNPGTGRIEVDGLTLWAHNGQPRTWARFGDTVRLDSLGTYTVHPAQSGA